jgi:hypothetical protein
MKISFTEHPNKLGETYLQHLLFALIFCSKITIAFVACLIHAFFPFILKNTGGNIINNLSETINNRRV